MAASSFCVLAITCKTTVTCCVGAALDRSYIVDPDQLPYRLKTYMYIRRLDGLQMQRDGLSTVDMPTLNR